MAGGVICQGLGASGETLQRAEGMAPFWVWGKLAAGIEPEPPSSEPGKPVTLLSGRPEHQAAAWEPRDTLSTHRADLAGLGQSGPTDPRAERGEELQPGADPGRPLLLHHSHQVCW